MIKSHHPTSSNLNSLKHKFTKAFLRALTRIKKQTSPTPSSPREVFQRYKRIKTAADKSLSRAVGSRRLWSRALLCKIRNQSIKRHHVSIRRRSYERRRCKESGSLYQTEELRKLVPGGEDMEVGRLLEEAAHYVQCLNTQVKVMRSIADSFST